MITEIASAISNVFKAISQALGMAHDKEQRDEGAIAQQNVDRAAELKAAQNALKAANNSTPDGTTDSLRNGDF